MKYLAVICARGGSKGVPNKNIRELSGKPLLAYTIEQALEYGKFDKIIVSTDSPQIAETARQYGAEVPFIRPAELATDQSPKLPVLQHAVLFLEQVLKESYDIIVDLDPTSPLRKVEDIDKCVKLLIESNANNVFTVTEADKNPYFNLIEECEGRAVLCKPMDKKIERRQDAPKVYALNAAVYAYWRDFLLNTSTIFSENTLFVQMPKERSFDIDTELDFKIVKFLMNNLKEKAD